MKPCGASLTYLSTFRVWGGEILIGFACPNHGAVWIQPASIETTEQTELRFQKPAQRS